MMPLKVSFDAPNSNAFSHMNMAAYGFDFQDIKKRVTDFFTVPRAFKLIRNPISFIAGKN